MSAVKRARVVRPETKARIVAAIREWEEVVGRPPGAIDWNRAHPKYRQRPETVYRSWLASSRSGPAVVATSRPGVRPWTRAIEVGSPTLVVAAS